MHVGTRVGLKQTMHNGRSIRLWVGILGGWGIWGIWGIWGSAIATPSIPPLQTAPLAAHSQSYTLSRLSAATPDTTGPLPSAPLRPQTTCPATLEPLTNGLLRDLPSYANRVMRRSVPLNQIPPGRVLLAGRPELEPLDLADYSYTFPPETADLHQFFFTTLERIYLQDQSHDLQHFHWAFLIETPSGWRLMYLFSSLQAIDSDRPPTPPQESSDGYIGQGIRLWLRDCSAGAIEPIVEMQ